MDNRFAPQELTPGNRSYIIREQDGERAWDIMQWDVLGGAAKWKMTNVRSLDLSQWRRLAEKPENRCIVPLTEFAEWTPEKHDLGDGKPPLKGEMWFTVIDQPIFAVAGFWQRTKTGNGFTMVTPARGGTGSFAALALHRQSNSMRPWRGSGMAYFARVTGLRKKSCRAGNAPDFAVHSA